MTVKEYMSINNYNYYRISSYRLVRGDTSKIKANTKMGDLKLCKDKKGMRYVIMSSYYLYNYVIRVYLTFQ